MKSFFTLMGALLAVAAVVYLSYLFSKYVSTNALKPASSKYMKMIDRIVIGQDRMLLIVMIGTSYYLVASGAQTIELLKELDPQEVDLLAQQNATVDSNFLKSFQNTLKGTYSGKNDPPF